VPNIVQQDFRHARHGKLVFQPIHGNLADILPPHFVIVRRKIKAVQGFSETVQKKLTQGAGLRGRIPVKFQQLMDDGGTDGLGKLVEVVLNGIIHHSPALQGNNSPAPGGNKIALLVKPGPKPVQHFLPPGIEHMASHTMIQVPLYFRAFNQAAGPGVPLINDYLMPFLQQHSGHGQSGNPGSDHSIFHHGIKNNL